MGDTISDAVDLEGRRRAMEDNLRRFRQVEQRQQPPAFQPEPTREPGIPSFVEDVFRQVGRFAAPGLEEAALPENVGGLAPPIPAPLVSAENRAATRYAELLAETRQSFPTRTPPGTTIESLALERLNEEMGEELRADQQGLFGKLVSAGIGGVGAVGKGISAVDEAAFQVNQFINEQLGTPPEQQPSREEFGGIITSRLTEGQTATLENIPVVGPAVAREAEFFSSPAGLAATLAWPALILKGAVGGIALASGARAAGAPEEVQIGAQVAGNILTPGAGVVPNLSKITGGLRGTQATAYVTRLTEEITTARSAANALREAGLVSKADELERFALIAEGSLARAEGRAAVAAATGDVIGEGALVPTRAEIGALQAVRATTIGDITAPEFAQATVRADVPATGGLISSQVLQPRPQTGPAILQTQLPEGIKDIGQRVAGAAGAETGGGLLPSVSIPERFLPQGGIPGGFVPRPKGMQPGAKVTGLSQEGEQIEGTLIQVAGEKAIIRDAAGNVRPVTAPELVEEAGGAGLLTRLQDIGRDFRFGPSSRTAVPSLDPSVQKFVKVLRTAKPTQRTLKAERAEELGRRAARGRVPFEAEARTPEEALAGLRRAQKGKLPEPPEFEVKLPSGEKGVAADAFTQEEVTNFINIARFSPALDRELFTRGNIIESLIGSVDKKGILFGRLPTPGELKNLERVYGAEFARELQKLRPFGERFWRLTLDALNIPRSFLAAFDLSFPFRQGVFAFARHPKEFFGNLPAMLRAAKNPEFAEQMVAAVKNDRTLIQTTEGFRPLNELMEEARLFLPDISGTAAFEARAEEFLSQLAHRIPGVGFSERGFIAYGDKLRSDIFRNTLQSWARQGKPATAEEIADLGIMLNVLTGRGNLPPELAKSLSFGFFAPRFAVSRPQLLLSATVNNLPGVRRVTGTVLGAPGQTARVSQLAAQELATSVGAGLAILSLVKMSGVGDVELNPLSSDFGKIRIGRTRIDFWGGARPWVTAIARMITEKKKTSTGLIVPQSLIDTLKGFGRSKLAPPAQALVDVSVGESAIGEDIGTTGSILNRIIPLAIQDFRDAIEQEGLTMGLLSIAAFLGVGFQTYGSDLADAYNRHVEAGDFGPNAPRYEAVETSLERRNNINKFDNLKTLAADIESSSTTMRAERSGQLLPLAQSVVRGTPGAARNYHENRSGIMGFFAGSSENEFKDLNITLKGKDNEILTQIYEIDFLEDRDGDGIPGDEDDVRLAIEEQDKFKALLSGPVRKALKNPENFFPDAAVIEVERRRNAALDKVDFLFDNISKYQGATVKESEQTDEYVLYVRQVQNDKLREFGEAWGWTLSELAVELGQEDGKPDLGQWASWALSDNILRNDEYDQYLIDNQAIIAPVFPFMYNRVVFRESGVLTDEIWREVNLPMESPAR
jgi:hypothetical protein